MDRSAPRNNRILVIDDNPSIHDDMMMPGGMTGRAVAEQLVGRLPSLKVIYTSGYSPGLVGEDLRVLEGENFLPKPFQPDDLLRLIRHQLDGEPVSA